MFIFTFEVDCQEWQIIGAKELIAMEIEKKYGNIRLVSVKEKSGQRMEQAQFSDFGRASGRRG